MLSEQAKERLGLVFDVAKTIFHIGFMPAVLYLGKYNNLTKNSEISKLINFLCIIILGFSKGAEAGMGPLSVASLLWQ